jgi:uncharacterized membrane protein
MVERKTSGLSGALRGATGVAGGTVKRAGSAARGATGEVSSAAGGATRGVSDLTGTKAVPDVAGTEAVERAGEAVQSAAAGAGEAVERAGGRRTHRTVGEELRQIVREAALEVLIPVARTATTKAATYAVTKSPQLARDTIAPKLNAAIEEAGGPGALAKRALSFARSGLLEKAGTGAEARRPWRERPVPVEEAIDVAVPLDAAYDRFTEFEEYANVLSHGEIVDERQDERIAWTRTDGVDATALITFHRLGDRLTRVMVDYDHQPQGVTERATSLFHTTPRRLNADLMRFKAYAETSADGEPEDEAQHTPTRPGEDG